MLTMRNPYLIGCVFPRDKDVNFSKSLIIDRESTKEIKCLMSVWKSNEKLLIFEP